LFKSQFSFSQETINKKKQEFYASHGFVAKGDEYMEDGIPHIAMFIELNI
tara:strand:+ start:419 stop:568 length:150 start_codon:yes stop_codon:yes gene_type:complete